jgi:hypothetical protein
MDVMSVPLLSIHSSHVVLLDIDFPSTQSNTLSGLLCGVLTNFIVAKHFQTESLTNDTRSSCGGSGSCRITRHWVSRTIGTSLLVGITGKCRARADVAADNFLPFSFVWSFSLSLKTATHVHSIIIIIISLSLSLSLFSSPGSFLVT